MNGRSGPEARELSFTTRMRAKNKILARNSSKGRLRVVSIAVIDWVRGGVRDHMFRDGRERMSNNWEMLKVVDRIIIGFAIGIGRLGHIAMKYENITNSPPT